MKGPDRSTKRQLVANWFEWSSLKLILITQMGQLKWISMKLQNQPKQWLECDQLSSFTLFKKLQCIQRNMQKGHVCCILFWFDKCQSLYFVVITSQSLVVHMCITMCFWFITDYCRDQQKNCGTMCRPYTCKRVNNPCIPFHSLWSSDAIWQYRSSSTLAQVMVCCLMAPSHYQNLC